MGPCSNGGQERKDARDAEDMQACLDFKDKILS